MSARNFDLWVDVKKNFPFYPYYGHLFKKSRHQTNIERVLYGMDRSVPVPYMYTDRFNFSVRFLVRVCV